MRSITHDYSVSVEECLVAYLSFDVVDTIKKLVYDEGPYGNDFTYNGNVQFLPANYSCKNAAAIDSDGDLYYAGPGFTNSPNKGATIAMWVHPTDLMHKQSIFTSKAIGSKGGTLMKTCYIPSISRNLQYGYILKLALTTIPDRTIYF